MSTPTRPAEPRAKPTNLRELLAYLEEHPEVSVHCPDKAAYWARFSRHDREPDPRLWFVDAAGTRCFIRLRRPGERSATLLSFFDSCFAVTSLGVTVLYVYVNGSIADL